MTRYQIRMTFSYLELLSHQAGITERIAAHPTRPARMTDANCWWEDIDLPTFAPTERVEIRQTRPAVADLEPEEVNQLMKIHPLPERWMDGAQVF